MKGTVVKISFMRTLWSLVKLVDPLFATITSGACFLYAFTSLWKNCGPLFFQ